MRQRTVDATHLLSNHNGRGTVVGPPNPRHCKAVPHTREIAGSASHLLLLQVVDVRVVIISSGDDRVGAQAVHGSKAFREIAFFHQPPRGLWTEPDTAPEDERGDEGGAKLETPCDGTRIFDYDIGTEAQEDACTITLVSSSSSVDSPDYRQRLTYDDPELPEHDKSTSDPSRCHLGRVDWYCKNFVRPPKTTTGFCLGAGLGTSYQWHSLRQYRYP